MQEAARLLRLTPYLERKPLELSGGQQQRTAIARALVKRAPLVLMDEPLANLDYKLREELREELPRIFAECGSVFVYATTEPAEALLLGGHVATLSEGRVTQFGMAGEVFRRPADLATARVFSDPPLNRRRQRIEGGRLLLGDRRMPLPVPSAACRTGRCTIGIRAHHLSLEPLPGAVAVCRRWCGSAEVTGSESYVHLDVGGAAAGWCWRPACGGRSRARRPPSVSTRSAAWSSARMAACAAVAALAEAA